MSKKRKPFRNTKNVQSKRRSNKNNRDVHNTLGDNLLAFIFKQTKPVSFTDISAAVCQSNGDKKLLKKELGQLLNKNEIVSAGKNQYKLNKKANIYSGKLEKNPRGFGFVTNLLPQNLEQPFVKDPFLSINRIGSANHGDTILIRIFNVRRDGRPEAELITILERNNEKLIGFFTPGKPAFVIPEDPRLPANIQIVGTTPEDIPTGHAVVVQILPNPQESAGIYGEIVEILGPPQSIDVQMRMVIEKHHLPAGFDKKTLQEAKGFSISDADFTGREDLRDVCHITIDGETAKDFDDAIAVEKNKKGFRLYVSIADVSHYVVPGSSLDKEAFKRGTSIYFPGRVIPMLPENLSNNLCSLVPKQDRLTFSAILDFDRSGLVISKKYCKSVIHSKHRFTYTTVKKILVDKDPKTLQEHKEFEKSLHCAAELAEILHNKRMKRGSIGFNIPEPEMHLKEDGNIESIQKAERNFAHQMIEEFMLAANEAVAETFSAKNKEFLYRIHEKPEPEKVKEFSFFAKTLGIELPPQESDPSWFGKVLAIVKDTTAEYVVNNLLLRTMQQARYDTNNKGHFGLAATDYTHFTSPIRRYPDLLVHRMLHAMLNEEPPKKLKQMALQEQAVFLSSRERVAVNAEREIHDRLKIFYMEKHIGESFDAIISGVNESALFIELLDIFVSGSIDISELQGDYYLYDAKRFRLIGEISGKSFQIGGPVRVTLKDIDHQRKRINFVPVSTEEV